MGVPPDPARLLPLGAWLLEAAQARPSSPHLQWLSGEGRLESSSYAESARAARSLAGRLIEAGVRPGEPVALLADPGPLAVQAIFGVWLSGGVLTPLDPQWEPDAHGRALRKARARFGVATAGRLGALEAASKPVPGFVRIEAEQAARGPGGGALPELDAASRALILFTSGTTGEPKAAVLGHRALGWNAQSMVNLVGAGPDDDILAVLPLHHVFGLLAVVLVPVLARGRSTFPRSLKGADVSAAMRSAGSSVIAAVPQLVLGFDRAIEARLRERGRLARATVAALRSVVRVARRLGINPGPRLFRSIHEAFGCRLRFLGSAGAPLDPEAAGRLWSLGFNVVEGYGMTEAGPAISFEPLDRPRFGSVGLPLPGVEVRIVEAGDDGVGEIVVRSPSLFEGYLDDPQATAEVLRSGWLHTGDLGRIDGSGRLWITGRKKEVIVLGSGKNVYPHEVEARLDESPFIRESCVLGLAEGGRRGTEKLHAVLVPDLDQFRRAGEPRIAVTLHDELNRIGDTLPSHHRIVGLTVRTEPLPRTPLGKLRRFQVERELLAALRGEGGAPERAPAGPLAPPESPHWPAVEGALRQASARSVPIGPSTSLELDLGLDSLARVEALAALEERLGRKLPDGFGASCLTAGELVEAVKRHLDESASVADRGYAVLATAADDADFRAWSRLLLRPVGFLLETLVAPPLGLASRLLWRWEVSGREHLPRGAFLVCPNHGSYADAVFILLALPWRSRMRAWAIGDHQIFSHPLMWVLGRMANVIRSQGGAGLKAMLGAGGAVLAAGRPLVLFPEGARAPQGERLTFRRGAAILARSFRVPIVPAWMEGVDRLLPRGARKLRFGHRMAVRFGAPLDPGAFDSAADPGAAMTEALRERVLALGAEEAAATAARERPRG